VMVGEAIVGWLAGVGSGAFPQLANVSAASTANIKGWATSFIEFFDGSTVH
jgi:hypothetical protein